MRLILALGAMAFAAGLFERFGVLQIGTVLHRRPPFPGFGITVLAHV